MSLQVGLWENFKGGILADELIDGGMGNNFFSHSLSLSLHCTYVYMLYFLRERGLQFGSTIRSDPEGPHKSQIETSKFCQGILKGNQPYLAFVGVKVFHGGGVVIL